MREELLIALLKSKQSHEELLRSKYDNAEIEKTKKNFNELRNRFSKKKKKKVRKKFRFREVIDEHLKELEKKNSLTEIRDKKHYTEKLKKTEEFLKKTKRRRFKQIRKASIP